MAVKQKSDYPLVLKHSARDVGNYGGSSDCG